MQKINFYILPSVDYQAITIDDILNLQDLIDYLKENEIFEIPNAFWDKEDLQGISAMNFLYDMEQNDICDYLSEILTKSKKSEKSYEEIRNSQYYGYAVISKNDILEGNEETCVYNVKDKICDKFVDVNDIVRIKRYYLRQLKDFNSFEEWAQDCFPHLIFHEEAFLHITRLGKYEDVKDELIRHLQVLNDVGYMSYNYYEGKEKSILKEFESGYQVICSGKGSNEEPIFHKEIFWNGKKYKLTCNPHTKLFKKNSRHRIYFCWGRDEIENHKIIIVQIGNHWE